MLIHDVVHIWHVDVLGWEKISSILLKPMTPIDNEGALFFLRQRISSSLPRDLNRLLWVLYHSWIDDIAADDESSSPCACVAMHKNLLSKFIYTLHLLTNHQHHIIRWYSQVLPEEIMVGNSLTIELIWVVRESSFLIDAVGTEWVFPRLLKVEDSTNIQLFHLCQHIVLSHLPRAWSLRCNEFVENDLRIKSDDDRILTSSPLLHQTCLPQTHNALELMSTSEGVLNRSYLDTFLWSSLLLVLVVFERANQQLMRVRSFDVVMAIQHLMLWVRLKAHLIRWVHVVELHWGAYFVAYEYWLSLQRCMNTSLYTLVVLILEVFLIRQIDIK